VAGFELWGHWADGKLQLARSHVTATELVDTRTAETLLDRVTTQLVYQKQSAGWHVRADTVELVQAGEEFTLEDVAFAWNSSTADEKAGQWQLDGHGQSLPLGPVARLSTAWMPVALPTPTIHHWLANSQAQGELTDWRTSITSGAGAPDITLHGNFTDINLQAVDKIPGVRNMNGVLAIDHSQGDVTLRGNDVGVTLPVAFDAPLSLSELDAELKLDFADAARSTLSGQIALNDDGLTSTSRLKVKIKPNQSPHVDLQTRFALDDVSQAVRYFPTRVMPKGATTWLTRALQAGRAENGELLLFGQLADFPFKDRQGVFKAGFDVSGGELNYWPSWPQASAVEGRVELNGLTLTGRATGGRLQSMQVSEAGLRIDNLLQPTLSLSATGDAKLQEMIAFGNTGPLSSLLKPALIDATGSGRAEMDLELSLPLTRSKADGTGLISHLKVQGSVFLRDNDVSFERSNVAFSEVVGAVGFNESGLRINNLRARYLDQPVSINGVTRGQGAEKTTEIELTGALEADAVLQQYELPLTRFVDGSAPHDSAVMARDGAQLIVTSDLLGTRLNLPQPLGKSTATPTPIRLQAAFGENRSNIAWNVDYGNELKSRVVVEDSSMRALSIRLGQGAVNTEITDGVRIDGSVPTLAFDGWVKSIADLIDDLPDADEPTPILPISADVRVASLIGGVQSIGPAQLRVNSDDKFLNAVVVNDNLSGNLRYPREHWRRDITARARISYADKRVIDALESGPEGESELLDPRLLPPIEARISRLTWDSLDLRDVTVRTSPKVNGLNIDTLGFAYRTTQLIGEGYWHLRDPQGVNPELTDKHVTGLSLTLQSDDIGVGLAELGFAGAVDEGEGVVSASLVWPGPAYAPTLESLEGTVTADVNRGRILRVEPGAARLVGLFALQTIPRRINFDFKDIVSDGLDFQSIKGNVALKNGVADAKLVQINGPVGVIDITGESNLITHQYDQRITVLPRVSAALPIIGAISGGASAGIGALIAGGFLKAIGIDLDRIGLREYSLKGDWDAPELEPIPGSFAR